MEASVNGLVGNAREQYLLPKTALKLKKKKRPALVDAHNFDASY